MANTNDPQQFLAVLLLVLRIYHVALEIRRLRSAPVPAAPKKEPED